ncbi:hypothetical protein Rumeso_01977 [Rubellimicrobium mesophilum DSM 19309]|uniref:Uncharacterized protein n=1 Tax=Rubellimicrobium mesophilum DSM 19309 TaxID=442562 RepID=A0A017HRM8_9RHOB|nr:hypothetical protein Rumeso_01977 [Rubellimicrobium mesophilum DSM 19309]
MGRKGQQDATDSQASRRGTLPQRGPALNGATRPGRDRATLRHPARLTRADLSRDARLGPGGVVRSRRGHKAAHRRPARMAPPGRPPCGRHPAGLDPHSRRPPQPSALAAPHAAASALPEGGARVRPESGSSLDAAQGRAALDPTSLRFRTREEPTTGAEQAMGSPRAAHAPARHSWPRASQPPGEGPASPAHPGQVGGPPPASHLAAHMPERPAGRVTPARIVRKRPPAGSFDPPAPFAAKQDPMRNRET